MVISLYNIPMFQNTQPRVKPLNISQKTHTVWSLELENIRSMWKKLINSEKITTILE